MNNKIIQLNNRAVISITGKDSLDFLQSIVTIDLENSNNKLFSSCLLTPQGKLLYHFFLYKIENGFLIDIHNSSVDEFKNKIEFYKLMSEILIKNREDLEVISSDEKIFDNMWLDPRSSNLGWRGIREKEGEKKEDLKFYEIKKIYSCIIEQGEDVSSEEFFPMELNYDNLNSISFDKGCFIGQEVTSRMYRKGKAKKRVFSFQSEKNLKKGQKIFFNDKNIGQILKTINLNGIALIKVESIPLIKKDPEQIFINKDSCKINFDFHKNR